MLHSRPIERKFLAGELAAAAKDANRLNIPIRDALTIRDHIGRNVGGDVTDWNITERIWGRVYNDGETKATFRDDSEELLVDARYWVKIVGIKAATQSEYFNEADDIDEREEWSTKELENVIATNLAEIDFNSHALPDESLVEIYAIESGKDAGEKHYYFYKEVVIAYGVADGPPSDGVNEITLTPCIGAEDETPTGAAAVTCYIISPRDAEPTGMTFEEGDILAYVPIGEEEGQLWPVAAGGGEGLFPVKVEKDGGSDGSSSAAATYTYTVRDLDGTTLGTAVTQTKPRPNGKVTFQTGSAGYGLAFYDGATLKLWDAGEKPTTTTCS